MWLALGLLLLSAGAEGLVRGGASLALSWRISPLAVGLTVVAFGTSAPELAVSVRAALADQGAIAAGNVVGSNIFNIAAILGLSAVIAPLAVHVRLIRIDIPLMLAVTVAGIAVLFDGAVSRVEGLALATGLVVYTIVTLRLARGAEASAVEGTPAPLPSTALAVVLVLAGLAGLVFGAEWFVRGAVDLARRAGMSEAVIGLTIVAAGTSLPELATSIVAAARRQTDIAIGNIVGSNLFNLLGILGIAATVKPLAAGGLVALDLVAMAVFAALLLPLAASGFTVKRWEGALLLAGYLAYVTVRLVG
jgi:cation:H+ antiporter